jgi:Family of unknown function (DUF6152)
MKTKLVTAVALVAGLLAVCSPVFAHHGSAAYDMTKLVAVKNGTVTSVQWGNPHVLVFFDVKDANGNVAHWVAEAGSPSADYPQGWREGSIKPGDPVTAELYQAKTGSPVGRMGAITDLATKKVFLWTAGTGKQKKVNCDSKTYSGADSDAAYCLAQQVLKQAGEAETNQGK